GAEALVDAARLQDPVEVLEGEVLRAEAGGARAEALLQEPEEGGVALPHPLPDLEPEEGVASGDRRELRLARVGDAHLAHAEESITREAAEDRRRPVALAAELVPLPAPRLEQDEDDVAERRDGERAAARRRQRLGQRPRRLRERARRLL